MKKVIVSICTASVLSLVGLNDAEATTRTHSVIAGDTLYQLGKQYGVSVQSLKQINDKQTSMIESGEQIVVPASISNTEKDLLARLVHAEAQGEPYAGKVAVATVVLNRVEHENFPDTITGVIEEIAPSGHYAFSPVQNGQIHLPAAAESKRAVNEALAFHGQGQGSLYFYNPAKATNYWNATRTETIRIGNHVFAK